MHMLHAHEGAGTDNLAMNNACLPQNCLALGVQQLACLAKKGSCMSWSPLVETPPGEKGIASIMRQIKIECHDSMCISQWLAVSALLNDGNEAQPERECQCLLSLSSSPLST